MTAQAIGAVPQGRLRKPSCRGSREDQGTAAEDPKTLLSIIFLPPLLQFAEGLAGTYLKDSFYPES